MELAEVLQGWFSRKWPGNTSCDAFLHSDSLIRAQPKKLVHFLMHHFIFSPRDPWFQRERGGDHTAWVGAAIDNGVYKWIFAFCYRIFHLQGTLTLFPQTLPDLGCTVQAGCVQVKQHQVFQSSVSVVSSLFGEHFYPGVQKVLSHSVSALQCFQHQLLVPLCLWSTFWSHWWTV